MIPYKDKGVTKSRPSPTKANRTEYLDKHGKVVGYSKPNFRKAGETLYFDKNGKKVGKEVRTYKNRNKSTFYDTNGKKTGSSYRSAYYNRTEYYDENKKQLFTGKKNPVMESRTTFFTATNHQKKGSPPPARPSGNVPGGPVPGGGCLTSVLLVITAVSGVLMLFR